MADRIVGKWEQMVTNNPQHSIWYRDRFRAMAAEGADLAGEARLIDAMVERGAQILDAGCGGGRLGGYLQQQGHQVTGFDIDPVLIEAAIEDYPGVRWLVDDLVTFKLTDPETEQPAQFDAIVCAGNAITFLADGSQGLAIERIAAHLAPCGRVVFGFGLGRGYSMDQFIADLAAASLSADQLFSTWDLRPFTADSDFVVAICGHAIPARP